MHHKSGDSRGNREVGMSEFSPIVKFQRYKQVYIRPSYLKLLVVLDLDISVC